MRPDDRSTRLQLAPATTIVGAVAGWAGALSWQPYRPDVRLAAACLVGLLGAALGAWLTERRGTSTGPGATRAFAAVVALATTGAGVLVGLVVGARADDVVACAVAGAVVVVVALPLVAVLEHAAERADAVRRGSVAWRVERNTIWAWTAVSVGVATTVALPGWLRTDRVELAPTTTAVVLAAAALATAGWVVAAGRAARLELAIVDALALERAAIDHIERAATTIDLGIGSDVSAHLASRGTYRSTDSVDVAVLGDTLRAREALADARRRCFAALVATAGICVAHVAAAAPPVVFHANRYLCARGDARACTWVVDRAPGGGTMAQLEQAWWLHYDACPGIQESCDEAERLRARIRDRTSEGPARAYEAACRGGDGASCFAVAMLRARQGKVTEAGQLLRAGCRASNRESCGRLGEIRGGGP